MQTNLNCCWTYDDGLCFGFNVDSTYHLWRVKKMIVDAGWKQTKAQTTNLKRSREQHPLILDACCWNFNEERPVNRSGKISDRSLTDCLLRSFFFAYQYSSFWFFFSFFMEKKGRRGRENRKVCYIGNYHTQMFLIQIKDCQNKTSKHQKELYRVAAQTCSSKLLSNQGVERIYNSLETPFSIYHSPDDTHVDLLSRLNSLERLVIEI